MKKTILFAALTAVFFACKKDAINPINANATLNPAGFMTNRVALEWDEPTANYATTNEEITFFKAAHVSSPIVNGKTTSATGLEIVGNFAYVTYHIAGSEYGGALEVFDISSPATPVLVSQLLLTDTDLNECAVANGKVYAVGGRDIYSSDFTANDTKGAVLLEVALNGNLLTESLRWAPLPSYSGNSVNVAGGYIFVVAGSTGGGVFTLNTSDLAMVQADYFVNPIFSDVKNNTLGEKMYVLQGENASIHEYTAGLNNIAGKQVHNILNQTVPSNGKAVVHVDGTTLYVCTGNNGLLAYSTNNISGTPTLNYNSPGDGNANGVTTDDKFIYIANGTEGVIILNKADQSLHSIFSFPYSANFVEEGNGYIFIANGKDGLNILKRVNPAPVVAPTPVTNMCGKSIVDCADPSRTVMMPENSNVDWNVNSGQSLLLKAGTSGQNTIKGLNNNAIFKYCGILNATNNTVNLNSNSYTEILGTLNTKHFNNNSCAYIEKLNMSEMSTFNSGSTTQITTGVVGKHLTCNNAVVKVDAGGINLAKNLKMNSGADMTVKGNVIAGGNFELEAGATLTINGNLTVDGNFKFHGKIVIIGNSTITINGNVQTAPSRQIVGNYTSNKAL